MDPEQTSRSPRTLIINSPLFITSQTVVIIHVILALATMKPMYYIGSKYSVQQLIIN